MKAASYDEYVTKISRQYASGGTAFSSAFNWVNKFIAENRRLKDISIVFFTDGMDGSRQATEDSIKVIKETMNKREVVSRFLTIGFSREHDAQFLNMIAQLGSELGNFIYIDTN